MVIHLNGESFHERPLQPFGSELIPAGKPVAFQPWLKANVGEISEFVRDKGLVVLSDALHGQGDEWSPIEPVKPHISTRFPHVDRSYKTNGPNDGLGWMLLGDKRSPTAFVPGKALRNAMVQHKEIITDVDAEALFAGYKEAVKTAQDCLVHEDWAHDTLPIQNIATTLQRARLFDRMLPPIQQKISWLGTLLNRAFDIPHIPIEERVAEQQTLAVCEKMLEEFQERILGSIEADTYKHDWSAHPHSAVLAWNNPFRPSDTTGDYVAHYATLPDPTVPQSNLGRLKFHNDTIISDTFR